ncbi:hypothetical protein BC831DRAFT_510159 [Entophlyctis helioformis]|nr:hypothetical protein BC831DRAFT_510159 [Entophlyctis helioformis]
MIVELAVAAKFLAAFAPASHQELFRTALCTHLASRYAGHWYEASPERGSAYRAVAVRSGVPDPLLRRAAVEAGLPVAALLASMPQDLTLWVDPFAVTCRQGDKFITTLWAAPSAHHLQQQQQQQQQQQMYTSMNQSQEVPSSPTSSQGSFSPPPLGRKRSPVTLRAPIAAA